MRRICECLRIGEVAPSFGHKRRAFASLANVRKTDGIQDEVALIARRAEPITTCGSLPHDMRETSNCNRINHILRFERLSLNFVMVTATISDCKMRQGKSTLRNISHAVHTSAVRCSTNDTPTHYVGPKPYRKCSGAFFTGPHRRRRRLEKVVMALQQSRQGVRLTLTPAYRG